MPLGEKKPVVHAPVHGIIAKFETYCDSLAVSLVQLLRMAAVHRRSVGSISASILVPTPPQTSWWGMSANPFPPTTSTYATSTQQHTQRQSEGLPITKINHTQKIKKGKKGRTKKLFSCNKLRKPRLMREQC
jgi:hypothetical protein